MAFALRDGARLSLQHVHDAATTLAPHVRDGEPDEPHRAKELHVEIGMPRRVIDVEERLAARSSR